MDHLRSEFETLRTAFRDKIDTKLPLLLRSESSQEKRLTINQATRDLEEADELVAEMEITASSLPTSQKLKATALVRACREAIRSARKDLQKFNDERGQLLGRGGDAVMDVDSGDLDQRERLLRGAEQLQNGSERLVNVQRIAIESESVGINTLSDLSRQREQIVRTRDTLDGADTWITQSTGVLRGMQWQLSCFLQSFCQVV
ncbi:hypothetical protein HDU98_008388 [Podochytrium sp. JEL0797]|nr:hypothetical protein HDU98_008388 [Podochytrium sp. JEL0797]